MMIEVRPATANDLEPVTRLLTLNELPLLGVREHFGHFLVARENGSVVGAIGLEQYGDTGLLRSAVVEPALQGRGIGGKLVESLVRQARSSGVKKLVLLTNTAEQYFHRLGFRSIDRNVLSGPVTQSVEFTDACPSHAVCMEKTV